MKGNYFVAAGLALAGIAVYMFWKRKNSETDTQPMRESERHHLTNAFAKAKQVATRR